MAADDKPTLEGLMTLVHRYGNREWHAGYADAEGKEATEQQWRTKADATRNEIRAYAERMLAAGVDVPLAPRSGWIPWSGGPRPVPEETVVFALRQDGTVNVWGLFARAIGWERDTHKWSEHRNVVAYYVVTEDVGTLSAAPHISSVPPPPRADGVNPSHGSHDAG